MIAIELRFWLAYTTTRLFADITAINRYLSDEQATYSLFLSLHENAPAFAIDCFDCAINAIVANHDFRLARSYILEPGAAVSVLLRDFNEVVKNTFQLSDKRHRAIRLQAETRNFVADVLLLLNIVRNTDGAAESEQLARAAIFGVSEETVRRRVGRKIGA